MQSEPPLNVRLHPRDTEWLAACLLIGLVGCASVPMPPAPTVPSKLLLADSIVTITPYSVTPISDLESRLMSGKMGVAELTRMMTEAPQFALKVSNESVVEALLKDGHWESARYLAREWVSVSGRSLSVLISNPHDLAEDMLLGLLKWFEIQCPRDCGLSPYMGKVVNRNFTRVVQWVSMRQHSPQIWQFLSYQSGMNLMNFSRTEAMDSLLVQNAAPLARTPEEIAEHRRMLAQSEIEWRAEQAEMAAFQARSQAQAAAEQREDQRLQNERNREDNEASKRLQRETWAAIKNQSQSIIDDTRAVNEETLRLTRDAYARQRDTNERRATEQAQARMTNENDRRAEAERQRAEVARAEQERSQNEARERRAREESESRARENQQRIAAEQARVAAANRAAEDERRASAEKISDEAARIEKYLADLLRNTRMSAKDCFGETHVLGKTDFPKPRALSTVDMHYEVYCPSSASVRHSGVVRAWVGNGAGCYGETQKIVDPGCKPEEMRVVPIKVLPYR